MKKGKKFTAALLCIMMMLTMMPAMAFADDSASSGSTLIDSKSTNRDSSLQLSKSLTKEDNGTYTIKMESYLNGDVESTGTATDFVVVLDQSGSMVKEEGFIRDEPAYITIGSGDSSILNTDSDLGAKAGFYQCKMKRALLGDTLTWRNMKYENGQWYYQSVDWVPIENSIRDLSDIRVLKIDAAKVAVREFVDTVADKYTTDNDHRIAVVGFSSNGYDTHKQNFTGGLVAANQSGLRNIVKDFDAEGGTYTHDGLQMAEDIFAAEKTANAETYAQRGHVVVVITDGEPGRSGFDTEYANKALKIGDSLKSTYNSKIYTIGLNLDASESSRVYKFMNYLSSNYSNVTSMNEGKNATAVDTGYYAAINSSSALTGILNAIASQYTTIPDDLKNVDENAVLVDTINSAVFDISGVDEDDVHAYTVDMVSGVKQDLFGDDIFVTNGTVAVSGFDYTDTVNNVVTYDKETNQPKSGKKLVVEITGLSLIENNILSDSAKIDSNSGTADIKVGTTSKVGVLSPQMDGVPVTIEYYYRDSETDDYTQETDETVTKYSIVGTNITSQYAFTTFGVAKDDCTLDKVVLVDHEITGDTVENDATYATVTDNSLIIGVYYTAENQGPEEFTVTYKQPTGVEGSDVSYTETASSSYTLRTRDEVVANVPPGDTTWDTNPNGQEFKGWKVEGTADTDLVNSPYNLTGAVTFVAVYGDPLLPPTSGTKIYYEQPTDVAGVQVTDYAVTTNYTLLYRDNDVFTTKGWDTPDGCEFDCWVLENDEYAGGATYTVYTVKESVTFVAKYKLKEQAPDTVTVTYKQPTSVSGNPLTGLAGSDVVITVDKGSEYAILGWDAVAAIAETDEKLTDWTKDGRYFINWTCDKTIPAENGTIKRLEEDVTYTAQYLDVGINYVQADGSDYTGSDIYVSDCTVTENTDGSVSVKLATFNNIVAKSEELNGINATNEIWTKPSKMQFSGWTVTEIFNSSNLPGQGTIEKDPSSMKDMIPSPSDKFVKPDPGISVIPSDGLSLYKGGADYTITSAQLAKSILNDGKLRLQAQANYEKTGGSHVIYYTLDFDSNGGSSIDSITAAGGTVIDVDKYIPTKKGYDFKGWYYDEALKNPVGSNLGLTSSMTIYAKWSEKATDDDGTPSDLNSKDHIKYVVGYPDGYVRPNNMVTRAETASMLYRLLTDERRAEVQTYSNNFTDVPATAWYVEPASSMYKGGYIAGYEDGTFGGDRNITRAEFVSMLVRFIGTDEGVMNFTDVPKSHWAYENIAIATAQGWISGYSDGTFKPDQAITRAEAMSIINRVLNRGVNASSHISGFKAWPDNYSNAWYYYDVIEATNSHDYTGERPSENWSNVK